MFRYLILFLFIAANTFAVSEITNNNPNKYTVNGFVTDSQTGEELVGAAIIVKELTQIGTVTNAYGFFSLTIPEGTYTITAHFTGYQSLSFNINLKQNVKQNFNLVEKNLEQKEIIVTGEKRNDNVTNIQMGTDKLDVKEIQLQLILRDINRCLLISI